MGLPRLPEPFHRVYSPPEAPRAKSRRPRTAGVVAAAFVVVAMGLAAVAVLVFGRGGARPGAAPARSHPATARSHPATARSHPATAGSRAADTPARTAQPPVFASLPQACSILPADTVRRLVPTAAPKIDKMGAETAGVCKYSMTDGGRYRAVQVDARAFLPKYMHDQATGMTVWSFEAQWRQAQKDRTADTSSLRRIGGLGDAAFERFWIDRDVRIAVGEATVRYRDIILRVQYTEEQPADKDRPAAEQRCLADAIAAARAGLASLH
ncbi:hypothetical protein [Actinoallomurus sp. NPDC052274]|uniref:hypothetical protein n=1 Tax=Actinoallomurus sp. NPDC052274 TaxID=3155420 RepID=UPI00341E788F